MSDRGSPDVLQAVGERMLGERVRLGLALEEAAQAADLQEDRLAGAEAGELALDEDELGRLAEAYGVDATAFFGGRVTPFQYLAGA
jgi:transcriptional regulator with XRE-family HTH domain